CPMIMPGDRPGPVEGLDLNEVKGGLIVYDPARDRVHYLNGTAAVAFALCDGERDVQAIAAVVTTVFGADGVSPGDVEACLAQLEDEGVLRSGG
ncbi:MAG: hypothetical protein QOE93_698, partial [Actinomycetota bacterium]|nr:hypothetical protein [Actinomycetota bacterium]